MFDFIANILTLVLTVLLPLYLTHRALQQSLLPAAALNPASTALLTPWTTYFAFLALLHTASATLSLPLLLPFYAWFRLLAHLYLLVPFQHHGRTQQEPGATYLYNVYALPFLEEHEAQIEHAIDEAHERIRSLPLVEWVRVKLLGKPPSPPRSAQHAAARGHGQSYAQTLLARFSSLASHPAAPAAGAPAHAPATSGYTAASAAAGEIYTLLSSALSAAGSASSSAPTAAPQPTAPPPSSAATTPGTEASRASYVTAQRERLRALLRAFDREEADAAGITSADASFPAAASTATATGVEHRSDAAGARRKSAPAGGAEAGADFEDVGYEDLRGRDEGAHGAAGRGWGAWIWGSSPRGKSPAAAQKAKGE